MTDREFYVFVFAILIVALLIMLIIVNYGGDK